MAALPFVLRVSAVVVLLVSWASAAGAMGPPPPCDTADCGVPRADACRASEGLVPLGSIGTVKQRSFATLAIRDDLLYLPRSASSRPMLKVFDVSDPARPEPLGEADLSNTDFEMQMHLTGRRAYLSDSMWEDDHGQVIVVDLSEPSSPVELGAFLVPGSPMDLAARGDLVYVASWDAGLRIFDASDPAAVVELGASAPVASERLRALALREDLAFGADPVLGLRVFDVSDPRAPRELSRAGQPASNLALGADGSTVFLTGHEITRDVEILDVSVPSRPQRIGSIDAFQADRLVIRGGTLYLAGGSSLHVVDVTRPTAPRTLLETDVPVVPFLIHRLAVLGNRLFLADTPGRYYDGLRIFDLGACAPAQCANGIDDDANGLVDHPEDPGCADILDDDEVSRQDLEIDVDPFSDENVVALFGPPGFLELAILGGPDAAAGDVVVERLALGPGAGRPLRDPTHPGETLQSFRDADGDGHLDLVVFFRPLETGLEPGDEEVCLVGEIAGEGFRACDRVRVVLTLLESECGEGFGVAVLAVLASAGVSRSRRAGAGAP